jgi:hypothetical protein
VIVDEEEFREAAERFGYSAGFRRACYEAAREGVRPQVRVQSRFSVADAVYLMEAGRSVGRPFFTQ